MRIGFTPDYFEELSEALFVLLALSMSVQDNVLPFYYLDLSAKMQRVGPSTFRNMFWVILGLVHNDFPLRSDKAINYIIAQI